MFALAKQWIEDRTGLIGHTSAFLDEQIPRSTGWRNTLGSAAGALLLVQILTGLLMMVFYVPHPDAAYASVEYIEESLRGGSLIRALHYWGASFIVVGLFIHVVRVVISGAYKKPREVTWLVGLALLGIVFGLAFTGQLLPWNQAGYWAAKVGVEIGGSAPVLGPYVRHAFLGGDGIGALTLTRFYTLHVVVLPALLGALVAFHLYLLRRHGPTPAPGTPSEAKEPFFPRQMARDLVVISAAFAGLIGVAYFAGGPQSSPADPADTSYLPRPEWFFLSHYEILRRTPGSMKILATFVLPNVLLLFFAALPWLDRGASRNWRSRKLIVGMGGLVFAGIVGLTALGVATEPQKPPVQQTGTYDMAEAGRAIYDAKHCAFCHRIDGDGEQVGPDLSGTGLRLQEDYLGKWLTNPQAFRPDTEMPPARVNRRELKELTEFLMSLRNEPAI